QTVGPVVGLQQPVHAPTQLGVARTGFVEKRSPFVARVVQSGEEKGLGTLRVERHGVLRGSQAPYSATSAAGLSQKKRKIRARPARRRGRSGARPGRISSVGSPVPGRSPGRRRPPRPRSRRRNAV